VGDGGDDDGVVVVVLVVVLLGVVEWRCGGGYSSLYLVVTV